MRSRNTIALLLLCGALLATMRGAAAGDGPPVQGDVAHLNLYETAKPAPDVTFTGADGRALSLADWRGRVLLVNFWATWCAPCVREMPELDALQAALGGDAFAVIAISQDRGGAAVAGPFLRERLGLSNLDLYLDKDWSFGRAMQLKGLPTTFLIDADGGVVGELQGIADWNGADARALIAWYVEGRGPVSQGGKS